MPNTNCLDGIRCPKCGSYEPFSIVVTTYCTVYDSGVEEHSDTEWDDDAYCRCVACDYAGTVADFRLTTKYAVNWDNGSEACGTFPERFDTEAEAEEFATNWARERNLEDLGLDDAAVEERGGEGCYTAEVIEVDEPGIDPKAAPDNPRPQWA